MTENPTTLSLGLPALPDGKPDWTSAIGTLGPDQAAAYAKGGFAVCQALPDGRQFLAVDRFARQTLCWRLDGAGLRCAERADHLGASDLDLQAIFDYLYFHAIPSPRTIYREVQRLPPGHYAMFDQGQLQVAPYWSQDFHPEARPDFAVLRKEFKGLLQAAVTAQLEEGIPACFLSGGTDSSTVAGLIKRAAGRVSTYSIGFDAAGYDEMEYARIAAKHFGADHHEYYVTPDDLVRSIAEVARSFDQPFGNSSVLPAYYCALRAQQDGVNKLLAGDGGDELFGGNTRYATQALYGLYGKLPAALRGGVIEPMLRLPGATAVPLLRKGSSYVRDARVPLPDRLQHYNLLQRLGLSQVLTPGFLAQVRPEDALQQQRAVWSAAQADQDIDRMLAFDWRYTLAESDLPKVRSACQLAGMRVGYPLLDEGLLDFSMRLPAHYKLRGNKLRWFFKEALRDFLPEAIINKKKKGFGLPFGLWATQHQALKALASDSLRGFAGRGIVQAPFVKALLEEQLPAHPGYYGEMVWILMMLEQWLRAHAPDWSLRA